MDRPQIPLRALLAGAIVLSAPLASAQDASSSIAAPVSIALPASTSIAAPSTSTMPVEVQLPSASTSAAPVAADAPTSAEQDFDAIYGTEYAQYGDPNLPTPAEMPQSYDPWEPFNRKMHTFNNAVDRTIAKPLAKAYVAVVPRPVRLGVGNFFSNLYQPLSALNSLLQGKPKQAGQAMGRFAVNMTLGIGGIFDPASDAKLPHISEDFGQTLGVWGWKQSRYVELPLFGPRTVRDVFGMSGDAPFGLLRGIEEDRVRIFMQGLQLVDVRTQLLSVDAMREGATDDYALVRDAWLQRRTYQIFGDRKLDDDSSLPDYLREENNPTVPLDAIPMTPMDGG
jgi:phospholipid-binding lipoprotein MlaA